MTRNLLTSWLVNKLLEQICNKAVEFIKLVASLRQACSNLSTSLGQPVRAHPVNKSLQQTCYKSAAGLLQDVRFYVMQVCYKMCVICECLHRNVFLLDYPGRRQIWRMFRDNRTKLLLIFYLVEVAVNPIHTVSNFSLLHASSVTRITYYTIPAAGTKCLYEQKRPALAGIPVGITG